MADIADRAQEVEELQREAALAGRTSFTGETADNCVECGVQIPSERQIALPGVQTCVMCAERIERGLL